MTSSPQKWLKVLTAIDTGLVVIRDELVPSAAIATFCARHTVCVFKHYFARELCVLHGEGYVGILFSVVLLAEVVTKIASRI
jgi:hypothetical protein